MSRRAVSNIVGGAIVLTLFLTALVAMVIVNQQYDTYQNTVNGMVQKDIESYSENVTAIYPGLSSNVTVSGCGGQCTRYNMTLANIGGIGVQVARVYINSSSPTGAGCVNLCVFDPTTSTTFTAYTFRVSEAFLNVGEMNHTVHLYLPKSIVLPSPTLTPSNSISVVTSRGRVFTFQWPFPAVGPSGGQGANPTIQTGVMKIAYNGTNFQSSKEGTGGAYCHQAAEIETWSVGQGKTLGFVNPWITDQIINDGSVTPGNLWVYANTVNSLTFAVTIDWGNINLQVANAASNAKQWYVGGPLAGVVYPVSPAPGVFTPAGTPVTIKPGDQFIMVFRILRWNGPFGPFSGSFSGVATVNNANPPGYTSRAEDNTFRALAIYCDGLYIRTSCT